MLLSNAQLPISNKYQLRKKSIQGHSNILSESYSFIHRVGNFARPGQWNSCSARIKESCEIDQELKIDTLSKINQLFGELNELFFPNS